MEIIKLISKIISAINRGFDILETVLKISNQKNINNTTDKNNK